MKNDKMWNVEMKTLKKCKDENIINLKNGQIKIFFIEQNPSTE